MKIYLYLFILIVSTSVLPKSVGAVMQSLNSQTGQNQTFSNDTNIGISSTGNVHSINWSGVLGVSRGGTGSSAFSNGSIPFISSGVFSEDNTNLSWDGTSLKLGGSYLLTGNVGIYSKLHLLKLDQTLVLDNTADIEFRGVADNTFGHLFMVASSSFGFQQSDELSNVGFLDFGSLTSDKTFTFPDSNGNIPLLEQDQTFSGLNKFESTSSNSTIYIGSSTKSGCIVLGDSDNSGLTYITANNGILSATFTMPSTCQ